MFICPRLESDTREKELDTILINGTEGCLGYGRTSYCNCYRPTNIQILHRYRTGLQVCDASCELPPGWALERFVTCTGVDVGVKIELDVVGPTVVSVL
jgi:hypothetical protein